MIDDVVSDNCRITAWSTCLSSDTLHQDLYAYFIYDACECYSVFDFCFDVLAHSFLTCCVGRTLSLRFFF